MSNVALYLAVLVLGSNFSSTTVSNNVETQPVISHVQLVTEEQRFVDLINSERTENGLNVLKVDMDLVVTARLHSKEMYEKGYFDHFSPTPGLTSPMDRYLAVVKARPRWITIGENLYYCSVVDVNRGHEALMKSPAHRANILSPVYENVGVGVYKSESGEFWVTEMFSAVK